ncbi:MAG: DUF3581 family protein [Porticoccaceae bacterium]|nr:DUF3581 family protein [Porticoccaceae bacterium]
MSIFLHPFYATQGHAIEISAQQGSRFAKLVCNDFNPLHDTQHKRFCVPGDLLFALALDRYGISEEMSFTFSEMLSAGTGIIYPATTSGHLKVADIRGRCYLEVDQSGRNSQCGVGIESLIRSYVRFSGQNFPHILMPLMKQHRVMINPQRPLVIYASMSLHLDNLNFDQIDTQLVDTDIEIDGRRGTVSLFFEFISANRRIGSGSKILILSGLREYQQAAVDEMIERYNTQKAVCLEVEQTL